MDNEQLKQEVSQVTKDLAQVKGKRESQPNLTNIKPLRD
jgi:hypothetical protein